MDPAIDAGVDTADLVFHEQADGRKVSRLPGGKVVLIALDAITRVKDGERWLVQLDHRETFAIAHPVQRLQAVPAPTSVRSLAPSATLPVASPQALPPPAPAPKPLRSPTVLDVIMKALPQVTAPKTPAEVVRKGDRVALFVDGANMDGAAREAGYFVDFAKAQRYFVGPGVFYAGFYFSADFTAQDPYQQRFLDFLSHTGFVVRKKPVKAMRDEDTGETRYKCNLDTELVIELLNTSENYDVAFLFSGDSDFERVVDILRSRGKRVYVVASRGNLARELGYVADKPIFYLEEHREDIERDKAEPGA